MSERRVNQQNAVNTWYRRFVQNLESKYHAELAWNLIMMGRLDAEISENISKPFLDRHKDVILKAMLTTIANRDPDMNYSDREIGEMMVGARKLGVAWGEFDTMDRSINAGKKVSESDDEHAAYLKHVMMYLKSYLLDRQYYDTFDLIQEIASMDDVPHDLKPLFDQHKHGMMTSLLKFVKHTTVGSYISPKTAGFDLQTTLWGLRNLGVDWPELKGLEKSVGSNRKAIREDAEIPKDLEGQIELIRQHPWMISKIWSPADELQRMVLGIDGMFMNSIKGGLSREVINEPDIRHNIVKHLLRLVKSNDMISLRDRLEDLRWKNVDWDEIRTIRKSLAANKQVRESSDDDEMQAEREQLVSEIVEAMTNGSGKTLRYASDAMRNLDVEGERLLDAEMRRAKHSIISNLVDMFFVGNDRDVEMMMDLLDDSPANWSEISRLPDSILPVVEAEFHDRAKTYGLSDTIEAAEALSSASDHFKLDDLMDSIRDSYLPDRMRIYGRGRYDNARTLGRDLSAMIQMDVPHADLKAMADRQKENVIRALLVGMKGRMYQDANLLVESLREVGVDWTEIRAIEKSLGSLHTLGESDEDDDDEGPIVSIMSPDEQIISRMHRRMREGSYMALHDAIEDLEDRRMPDHMIEEMLSPQADSIVRWLQGKLKEGLYRHRIVDQIWKLLEMGARWGSLRSLLEANESIIVSDMLTRLKNDAGGDFVFDDLEGHLRQLDEIGIRWPALGTISKSVNAELDKRDSIDEAVSNDFASRIANVFYGDSPLAASEFRRMLARKKNPRDIAQVMFAVKPTAIRWMLRMLQTGNNYWAKDLLEFLDSHGVDWSELKTIRKSIDADDRASQLKIGNDVDESQGKLANFARKEIQELVTDTSKELTKPHTTLALRGLLNKMHTQYDLTMDEMREFLAPIHDAMLTKMDKDLQGRAINITLGDLAIIKRLGLLVPEMTNMVQKNKTPILRYVFSRIGELQSANRVMEFVERLESFGIDWPELDTIRKSATAEFKQTRQQLNQP